jgi:predicted dehydrogenase
MHVLAGREGGQMKVAVIGLGSIGKRHAVNLKRLGVEEVVGYDIDTDRMKRVARETGISVNSKMCISPMLDASAWVVCTPPEYHLQYLTEAAAAGIHCLVEKPIAQVGAHKEAAMVAAKFDAKNLLLYPAYCLRHHSTLREFKKRVSELGKIYGFHMEFGYDLRKWRSNIAPGEYVKGYNASQGLLPDMTHEIDAVRWILDEDIIDIRCFRTRVGNLDLAEEAEDSIDALLYLSSRIAGTIHADMVQKDYHRSYRFWGELGAAEWRYVPETGDDMYIREMREFLDAVRRGPSEDHTNGKISGDVGRVLGRKHTAPNRYGVSVLPDDAIRALHVAHRCKVNCPVLGKII